MPRANRRQPRSGETKALRDTLHVVVAARGTEPVGLVVDGVLDIVEEDRGAERPRSRPGVLRCSVMREKITEMLDFDALLERALAPERTP